MKMTAQILPLLAIVLILTGGAAASDQCFDCVNLGNVWCSRTSTCLAVDEVIDNCPRERDQVFLQSECPDEEKEQCYRIVNVLSRIGTCSITLNPTQSWLVMPIIRLASQLARERGAEIPSNQGKFSWTQLQENELEVFLQLPDFREIAISLSQTLEQLSGEGNLTEERGWVFDGRDHIKANGQEQLLEAAGVFDRVDALNVYITSCCMQTGDLQEAIQAKILRDLAAKERKEKEARERAAKEKEAKEKEAREQAAKEKDVKEKEVREAVELYEEAQLDSEQKNVEQISSQQEEAVKEKFQQESVPDGNKRVRRRATGETMS